MLNAVFHVQGILLACLHICAGLCKPYAAVLELVRRIRLYCRRKTVALVKLLRSIDFGLLQIGF